MSGTDPYGLILMVGLPRSGKTTVARGLGLPIVNPDSVRLALHGQRFIPSAEPMVWAMVRVAAHALLMNHNTIIIDACNQTFARRDEWYKWASRLGYEMDIEVWEIPTTPDICIDRAVEAGDTQIAEIITKMANEYEPLGPFDSTRYTP